MILILTEATAEVNIDILWSISQNIQCLNSQQLLTNKINLMKYNYQSILNEQ